MRSMILGLAMIVGLWAYFLPTAIAAARGVRRIASIFAVNLVFGWTIMGWIATLLWVLSERRSSVKGSALPSLVETDSWSFDRSKLDENSESNDRWVLGREGKYLG